MPYTPPAMTELKDAITGLRKNYKNNNSERVARISLLEQLLAGVEASADLSETQKRDLLIGGMVLIQEDIASEYKFRSPENSTLYVYLKNALKLSAENKIADDERFLYFSELFLFQRTSPLQLNYSGLKWKSSSELLRFLEADLKYFRSKHENARIAALKTSQPTLEAIEAEIKKLCAEYLDNSQNRMFGRSEERMKMIQFINFIRETFDANMPAEQLKTNQQLYLKSFYLRLGLMIFTVISIDDEYGYTSPDGNWYLGKYNGSDLFRLCKSALNITDLKDLKCEQKMAWLTALLGYVDEVSKQQDLRFPAGYQERVAKLRHYCTHKNEIHNQPGWLRWGAEAVARNGASYAAGAVITTTVIPATASAVGLGTVTALGIATGPVGWLVLGASTLLASQLMRTAGATATGWALAYMIDRIGDMTGNATRRAIRAIDPSRPHQSYKLEDQPELTAEQKAFIERWINAVLELPDSVVSADEKKQIRFVLGLDSNALTCEATPEMAAVFR